MLFAGESAPLGELCKASCSYELLNEDDRSSFEDDKQGPLLREATSLLNVET